MATTTGKAHKFMKKLMADNRPRLRKIICIQLLIYTVLIAAVALLKFFNISLSFAIPVPEFFKAWTENESIAFLHLNALLPEGESWTFRVMFGPLALYLGFVTSLFTNAPLTAVARKTDDGAMARMSFWRVLITLFLAGKLLLAAWGVYELGMLINAKWTVILEWMTGAAIQLYAGIAIGVIGLVLLIYLCGVLSAYSRMMMLYMTDSPEAVHHSTFRKGLANGFKCGFTPFKLFLRHFFWFLLQFIITLALLCGAILLLGNVAFVTPIDITTVLLQAWASLYTLPAWAYAVVAVAGGLWVLGLGVLFWPGFNMTRLYYYRLVMRDTEMMGKKKSAE